MAARETTKKTMHDVLKSSSQGLVGASQRYRLQLFLPAALCYSLLWVWFKQQQEG